MGGGHCGFKIPRGSRPVGKIVEYPMEGGRVHGSSRNFHGLNPTTLVEVHLFPWKSIIFLMGVAGRFHGVMKVSAFSLPLK